MLRARAMTTYEALHAPTGNKLLLAKGCDLVTGAGEPVRSVDDVESYLHAVEGTGRVLALVSKPGFDPNEMSGV